MSKGGGSTTTNTEPWKPAQPYVLNSLQMAQQVANSGGPRYYQGQATLDPNTNQLGGFGQLSAFDQQVFGSPNYSAGQGGKGGGMQAGGSGGLITGGPRMTDMMPGTQPKVTPPGFSPTQPAAPQYGNLVGATNQLLAGGPAANLGNATANAFGNQLGQFGGPSQIGNYGFDPTLNAGAFTPQFGQAGGLDATSAYQQMLSGTPDYNSVQANADNANQQLIQNFQQNVLPQIAGRGIISGSDTGAIKSLATQLPNLATGIQANVLNAREAERQRALGAQASAAGQVAQGGLQAQGLGLQGAGQQTGYLQQLAQMQQQGGLANANLQGDYRSQLLGLGGLGSNLAGQAGQNMQAGANLWPTVYQQGQQPGQNQLALGDFTQGIGQQQLTDYINQFNQQAQAPQDLASWYSQIVNGTAGLGGTQKGTQPGDGGATAASLGLSAIMYF